LGRRTVSDTKGFVFVEGSKIGETPISETMTVYLLLERFNDIKVNPIFSCVISCCSEAGDE
jgi:hypothetical protein